MKKTLLLFAMLLSVVGAWAQVVIPEEGKYYVIKNLRSEKYATFEGDNVQLKQYANKNAYAVWYVTDVAAHEGGISCKLHNAATENIYASYNSFTDSGVTTYIIKNPYNEDVVCVSTQEDLSSNCWDDQGSQTTIGNYNPRQADHQGTSWSFEDVTSDVIIASVNYVVTDPSKQVITGEYQSVAYGEDFSIPAFVFNLNASLSNVVFEEGTLTADIVFPFPVSNNEVTNKLMINGYAANSLNFKMYAKENTYVKVDKDLDPTVENIDNYLWAIYPNLAEGTYTIKNVATGKFIYSEADAREHGNETLQFKEEATPFILVKDGWGYSFKVANKVLYLSVNSSNTANEQPVGLWGNTHAGSSWRFIPYVIKYTLTDVANNQFTGEYEGWAGFPTPLPTFTGAEGNTVENYVWNNDLNTVTANITFPVPVSSATVVNPTLIGQGTWANADKKWTVVDGNVKVVNGTATLGASQWLIYPTLTGTEFTFKIKSVSTDKYVTANPASNADAQANNTPITLTDDGTKFQFKNTGIANINGFAYQNNGGTILFITRNGEADNNALLGVFGSSASHKGNGIRFPELDSYTFKIGATGYTTLYSPIAGTISAGATAYAITQESLKDGYVSLTEMDAVAANEGVIVHGTPNSTYTFTAGDVTADWSANLLKGSAVNTYVEGEAYVLSAPDNNVGLYKAALNKDAVGGIGTTHFLNNAGKAYLPVSALTAEAAEARFFVFDFGGEETAIENVEAENAEQNAVVYDLAGRRVQNAQKGIFIVNGKVVIK